MFIKLVSAAFILSLTACATTPRGPVGCQIGSYGSISPTQKSRLVKTSKLNPNQPLGERRGPMKFEEETTTISAALGQSFGLRHRFDNIPKGHYVDAVIIHPEINYPRGKTTRSTWKKKPTSTGTSFTFDSEVERMTGLWTFSFLYKEKELCSLSFDVNAKS